MKLNQQKKELILEKERQLWEQSHLIIGGGSISEPSEGENQQH